MASITPDPKKRGYLLPPGCKDLTDVLQRQHRRKIEAMGPAWQGFAVKPGEPVTSQLSELEGYVRMACGSDALMRTLALHAPEVGFAVSLHWRRGVAASASLNAEIGTAREKTVREFVARHGFALPVDTAMPVQFRPDLPVYQIYHLSPLPPEAPLVASVLKALFHEVAGLDDGSAICFRYDEVTATA